MPLLAPFSRLVPALAAAVALAPAAAPAPSGPAAATYVAIAANWPIAVIGAGHIGAGSNATAIYTWNGRDLAAAAYDVSGSDSRSWQPHLTGIDAAGTVVGDESIDYPASTSGIPASTAYAALAMRGGSVLPWLDDAMTDAAVVNEAGVVAGTTSDGSGFTVDAAGTAHRFTAFAASPFGRDVRPGAIDTRGDVAGTSSVTRAMGVPLDLAPPPPRHIFLLRAGTADRTPQDLGTVPGCARPAVVGMDDAGRIVGDCTSDALPPLAHAWIYEAGTVRLLPALPGDDTALATAVTPGGLIVGASLSTSHERAVTWQNGVIRSLAAQTTLPAGTTDLDRAISASPDGWILSTTTAGDDVRTFVLAPPARVAEAVLLAHAPAVPSPAPRTAPIAAPAPQYTVSPITPVVAGGTGTPPTLVARWTVAGASVIGGGDTGETAGAVDLLEGGKLVSVDRDGKPRWTLAVEGDPAIELAAGNLYVRGPRWIAIDGATGHVRWTQAEPLDARVDSGSIRFADRASVRRLALDTGATLASVPIAEGCSQPLLLTKDSYGCVLSRDDLETGTLTGFDDATGRRLWAIDDISPQTTNVPVSGSTVYFTFPGGLLALHPARHTYDALAVPLSAETGETYQFDGPFAYQISQGAVVRFRLDRDPATEPVLRFPNDGTTLASSGLLVRRSPKQGVVVTGFDAAGAPSAVAYPTLARDPNDGLLVLGSHLFVGDARSLWVVDLPRRRIAGRLPFGCEQFEGGTLAAGRAILGCRTAAGTETIAVDLP